MTEKRRATWFYFADYIAAHGYSPTVQETADHFGLRSLATANKRIQALVDEGYAMREGTRARNVRLLFVPTSGLLRLDQALRTAGDDPQGRVRFNDREHNSGSGALFTREDVLAVGWEVV